MYPKHDYGTYWWVGENRRGDKYMCDTRTGRVTLHEQHGPGFSSCHQPCTVPRKIQAAIKRIPQASEEMA